MESLEDVLNGAEAEEEQVETKVEAKATEEQAPTGEKEASSPEAENDPVKGLEAGIAAERHKRQQEAQRAEEAERRYKELEAYVRQQQGGQQAKKPDFWEDPEGALNRYAQGLESQMWKRFSDMSEDMMRSSHADYDETIGHFSEMVKANPALVNQLRQSSNPAKFAYEVAKKDRTAAQLSDPNYLETLKAQWREEFLAEQKASVEQTIQKTTLPGTLSTARAAGGSKRAGHESLEEIMGR